MAYEQPGGGPLDYHPCRHGNSKLLFRGPKRAIRERYCAIIGGSETYGKYVRDPYPALVERVLGRMVLNLGCMNAGADVLLNEPVFLDLAAPADVTVIQVLGAHNLSNRFYSVHPRRNDRFLHASHVLRTLYPEVDFTEFHYTRHLLQTLRRVSIARYELIEQELKAAWVARMRQTLHMIPGPTVLLSIGDHRAHSPIRSDLWPAPFFIDAEMLANVGRKASALVRFQPSAAACSAGTEGMFFAPLDAPAAAELPGPQVHAEIAETLAPVLARYLK
jgi:hypothetical protein